MVRRQNLANFAARLYARDPQAGADLKRAFASCDLAGQISGAMRPIGLNPNNVADTMALCLVTAWHGVRGRDDTPSPAMFRAVSRQMRMQGGSCARWPI